jgi:hypothetical protein
MRYLIIFLLQIIISNISYSQVFNNLLRKSTFKSSYDGICAFFEDKETQIFGFGGILPENPNIIRCNSCSIIQDSIHSNKASDCIELKKEGLRLVPLNASLDYPDFGQILDKSYEENEKIVKVYYIDNYYYIIILSSIRSIRFNRNKRTLKVPAFTIVNVKSINGITEILLQDPLHYPQKSIENIEVYKTTFKLKNNPIAFVKVGWKTSKRKKAQYEVANINVYHLRA